MRLNTRRRTAVATTTRLARYPRNDKVRRYEGRGRIDGERALVGTSRGIFTVHVRERVGASVED